MPCQETSPPRGELFAAVTVLFHTPMSAVVGAVPDAHDVPRFRALVLFALITSAACDPEAATAAISIVDTHVA
jgi:hypothetical protein